MVELEMLKTYTKKSLFNDFIKSFKFLIDTLIFLIKKPDPRI